MTKANGEEKKVKVVVAVSGGFDPIHVGHVRLFQRARALGDALVVILNNDHWLQKKKGVVFMSQEERKEIIGALTSVDQVILTEHTEDPQDMSVCVELEKIRPDIFANGGDRDRQNADNKNSSLNPEQLLCQKLGIRMVFNVGDGGKVQSSSWLLAKYVESANDPGPPLREA